MRFSRKIPSNIKYDISDNADWLTVEKSDNGIILTAEASNITENRTAMVTLSNEDYNISKSLTVKQEALSVLDNNVIIYTTSDGAVVTPYATDVVGANIVSNTYENGKGGV